jgi:hypothetical protein
MARTSLYADVVIVFVAPMILRTSPPFLTPLERLPVCVHIVKKKPHVSYMLRQSPEARLGDGMFPKDIAPFLRSLKGKIARFRKALESIFGVKQTLREAFTWIKSNNLSHYGSLSNIQLDQKNPRTLSFGRPQMMVNTPPRRPTRCNSNDPSHHRSML